MTQGFSQSEINEFRELLIERRQQLLDVEATGKQSATIVELDQTKVGRLSRMDAMQTQAMSIEINRRRDIDLQRIELAMERLEKGEYGKCINCGEYIASGRLRFDPATPVCIECAS